MNRNFYCAPFTLILVFILCGILFSSTTFGQCNDWHISASLTTASTCAANGTFDATIAGGDAANLTNIQFGIPLSANGFSVPLNSSPHFSSIPPGTYQVSAVASCGGAIVGRNTTMVIPGNYVPPSLSLHVSRNSLNCAANGGISAYVTDGVPPFSINIVLAPWTYNGPRAFNTGASPGVQINNLPPGTYMVHTIDACNSGTSVQSITVAGLDPATIPLYDLSVSNPTCDSLFLPVPVINSNVPSWNSYYNDSSFRISMQIGGGLSPATPFVLMPGKVFSIKLPPGKSIKDYYGQVITWTIRPPCGADVQKTQFISYPYLSSSVNQNCNVDFKTFLGFQGAICTPITYTITGNNTTYGPFTATGRSGVTPTLPLGTYSVAYTTGDGYITSEQIVTSSIPGIPYSVSILGGAGGLNNYIDGFSFQTTAANIGYRQIELFSGPAGYTSRKAGRAPITQSFGKIARLHQPR